MTNLIASRTTPLLILAGLAWLLQLGVIAYYAVSTGHYLELAPALLRLPSELVDVLTSLRRRRRRAGAPGD